MMCSRFLLLGSAFASAVVPATAAPVSPVYKVVRSGALAPMGFHYYLEGGCRSAGPVVINLVVPPRNGEVTEGPRSAHPSYGAGSHLAACDRLKVRGTQVYYTKR